MLFGCVLFLLALDLLCCVCRLSRDGEVEIPMAQVAVKFATLKANGRNQAFFAMWANDTMLGYLLHWASFMT